MVCVQLKLSDLHHIIQSTTTATTMVKMKTKNGHVNKINWFQNPIPKATKIKPMWQNCLPLSIIFSCPYGLVLLMLFKGLCYHICSNLISVFFSSPLYYVHDVTCFSSSVWVTTHRDTRHVCLACTSSRLIALPALLRAIRCIKRKGSNDLPVCVWVW